jgi:predicted PurR-regulated permease PerM
VLTYRALIAGACLVVITWGAKAIAPLLDIFLLALLLAMTLSPLMVWLKRRLSPSLAVLVTVLVAVVGGVAVITLVGASITQLVQRLPTYQTGLTTIRDRLLDFLTARGINTEQLRSIPAFDPAHLVSYAGALLSGAAGALGNAFVVVLITVLVLAQMAGREPGDGHFDKATEDVVKYVGLTGITGLMAGVAITIALLLLGIDFAVTWGVLYFFFNFVPAIGNLLALAPAALVAYLEHGWERAVLVIVIFVLGNFLGDNVLKPMFMKKGFDISLLAIFGALLFWNFVLGAPGMLLAVPLTLTLKRLAQAYSGELKRLVTE